MNREFIINIFFLITINLLIKPFYIFGIDRTIQNISPEGEYGLYFALFNFTFLFNIINDFGVQNFNNRNIAQHNQLVNKYFPNIIVLKTLLGGAYLITIFIAAWGANYPIHYFHLIFFIAINQILNTLMLYLRSNVSGLGLYRTDSILSIINKVLMIAVCGVLLWFGIWKEGSFRIEWFVYTHTATLIVTCLITFLVLRKHLQRIRLRFKPNYLWLILKKSYPYAFLIFLMTAYSRLDGVMIERMLTDGKLEADIYASAYRLLDASSMIGYLFASLLLPMFARLLKEKKEVNGLLRMSFQLIWSVSVCVAGARFLYNEEIMTLLYDTGGSYSGSILTYLILGFVPLCGIYIYSTLLTANGSMRSLNIVGIIGVIINLGLNYFLIPEYKAYGAALATCITQFAVFITQIILCIRILDLKIDIPLLSRVLIFIPIMYCMGYFTYNILDVFWFYGFIINLLLGGVIAVTIKLIDLKNLQSALNEKA